MFAPTPMEVDAASSESIQPDLPAETAISSTTTTLVAESETSVQSVQTTENAFLLPNTSTKESNFPESADDEYFDLVDQMLDDEENFWKEIPEFQKKASKLSSNLKTRYNTKTGVTKYLDDLAKELETFAILHIVRKLFIAILKATPATVSREGLLPPVDAWRVNGHQITRGDIVKLEHKLDYYFGFFMDETGWLQFIKAEPYFNTAGDTPVEAKNFYKSLSFRPLASQSHFQFDELIFSVKIAWLRSRQDQLRGERLPEKFAIEAAIGSWSSLKSYDNPPTALTRREAERMRKVYGQDISDERYSPNAEEFFRRALLTLRQAQDNIVEAQRVQEHHYNLKRRNHTYKRGDWVLIHRDAFGHNSLYVKIQPVFYGPFKLVKDLGNNTFEVDLPSMNKKDRELNVQCFRPYQEPEHFLQRLPVTDLEIRAHTRSPPILDADTCRMKLESLPRLKAADKLLKQVSST
ncbi:hypothetical protein CANINC_002873 [Pichia inconspicua]|uniref:Uncharacterized protein n=1 Tax=Pichia inconspicua TaxID=52247 RepID=A0A4T0X0E5_9ASCO|nr:hypothetical protein CANINC_002873 [[Candida] inconspicua]